MLFYSSIFLLIAYSFLVSSLSLFLNLYFQYIKIFINKTIITCFCCEQQPRFVDPLNITAMACPAFPLCPLAITEAERGIPDILKRIRAVFDKVSLQIYMPLLI